MVVPSVANDVFDFPFTQSRNLTISELLLGQFQRQEQLVAVEPYRPPMTNVGAETAFRSDHGKHFQKSKHLFWSEVS